MDLTGTFSCEQLGKSVQFENMNRIKVHNFPVSKMGGYDTQKSVMTLSTIPAYVYESCFMINVFPLWHVSCVISGNSSIFRYVT